MAENRQVHSYAGSWDLELGEEMVLLTRGEMDEESTVQEVERRRRVASYNIWYTATPERMISKRAPY